MNTRLNIKPSRADRFSSVRLAEVFRQIDFTPRYKYGPHSHHRLEINYVKRGSCTLFLDDNTSFQFKKDDLMVIPSHLSHTFESGPRGTRLIQLEFMPELFAAINNPIHETGLLHSSHRLLVIRNNLRIKNLLQTIIWELQHEHENFRNMVMSCYMQLLILLQRENLASKPPVNYPLILVRALDLIHSSATSNKSLTDIAADLNVSTRYIRQLFSSHLGMSPSHYILAEKIERAKELLANTDLTIKEISNQCGFSSQRHFNTCFRRIMGYPPSKHLG